MKKIQFNAMLFSLSAVFFISSSFSGETDNFVFSSSYQLFVSLLVGKADRAKQYMIFEVIRSDKKVLAEDNVNYKNFSKELKKLEIEFLESEKRDSGLSCEDKVENPKLREKLFENQRIFVKQREELREKYGVYYGLRSVAAQSLPVKLMQDFIFEKDYEYIRYRPEVNKRVAAIFNIIQRSIKQNSPCYANRSITKSEEIKTFVSKKEAALSDILKAIDLTQLGETDTSIIPLIKDVALEEKETKEFTISRGQISGDIQPFNR
jgi:hypothetical protein